MKAGTEMVVMWPQTRGCWGPPEGSLTLRDFKELVSAATLILDF